MMKIFFCLIVIISCNYTRAQNSRPNYSGHFNLGTLYGSNKSKLQVQTIHGIKINTWFAGLGVGIDDYYQQSVPVFLDVRKSILKTTSTPFVYIDGGINICNKKTENDYQKIKLNAGIFYEGGVGYKVALSNSLSLNIAAGYGFKSYQEKIYSHEYLPIPPYRTGNWIESSDQQYNLQRFVLKAGLQF